MLIRYLLILSFPVLTFAARAQIAISDFSLADTSKVWFDKRIGQDQTELMTGTLVVLKRKSLNSHPYFGTGTWAIGSLSYRGEVFEKVEMFYDIYADLLYVTNNNSNAILLRKDYVAWFELQPFRFVKLVSQIQDIEDGFYALLYDGSSIDLFIKKRKSEVTSLVLIEYESVDLFYISINSSFYQIRNKRSILKLFPIHKKSIKSYFQQQQIYNFKNVDLVQLKELGVYLNTLKANSL